MAIAPKTNELRPRLPETAANPLLAKLDLNAQPPVKFQVITREGQDIVVGRLKIPTPGGHAFVLRRFDTGAVSVSTMFRAAFPNVVDDLERVETTWIKANFDIGGANGGHSGKLRLAGMWVPTEVALWLAKGYHLEKILPPLANASPDPQQSYRKSSRGSAPSSPAHSVAPPPYTPTAPQNKRRREDNSASSPATLPALSSTTKLPIPPSYGKPQSKRAAPAPPIQEDEELHEVGGAVIDSAKDIAESKALVANLKAQRNAAIMAAVAETPSGSKTLKRIHQEEEPYKLNIVENPQPVEERKIAGNRRVSAVQLNPNQKAAAWGALLFTLGVGASAILPSFF